MSSFKKLIGDRIYLSPLSSECIEKYATWMNDFQVTDYIGRSHGIATLENEKEWASKKAGSDDYVFNIVKLENDEIIGTIEFQKVDFINRTACLGIMIGEADERSKGYGTEAIGLILDFGFNYLNLNSVYLSLLCVNDRAKRCYEKAGFKEFGRRRMCRFVNGKYYDQIYMDILKDEFEKECIRNKNV